MAVHVDPSQLGGCGPGPEQMVALASVRSSPIVVDARTRDKPEQMLALACMRSIPMMANAPAASRPVPGAPEELLRQSIEQQLRQLRQAQQRQLRQACEVAPLQRAEPDIAAPKRRGRPTNPSSKRQRDLAAKRQRAEALEAPEAPGLGFKEAPDVVLENVLFGDGGLPACLPDGWLLGDDFPVVLPCTLLPSIHVPGTGGTTPGVDDGEVSELLTCLAASW